MITGIVYGLAIYHGGGMWGCCSREKWVVFVAPLSILFFHFWGGRRVCLYAMTVSWFLGYVPADQQVLRASRFL